LASIDFLAISNSLRTLAVFLAVIVLSYAGFVLITNQNPQTRSEYKEIIASVFIGLCILFLSPFIGVFLTGGSYCGG